MHTMLFKETQIKMNEHLNKGKLRKKADSYWYYLASYYCWALQATLHFYDRCQRSLSNIWLSGPVRYIIGTHFICSYHSLCFTRFLITTPFILPGFWLSLPLYFTRFLIVGVSPMWRACLMLSASIYVTLQTRETSGESKHFLKFIKGVLHLLPQKLQN